MHFDLSTNIGRLGIANPTMLASGILGVTAESLQVASEGGAGAVVTKSIGLEPRSGHKNPTFLELEHGLLNAMGLPNPGIEEFARELAGYEGRAPAILSLFAGSSGDFRRLARLARRTRAVALELNLSCPHAKGYGAEIGSCPDGIRRVVRAVKSVATIPVFAKLSPDVPDFAANAEAVEKAGGDAVVGINTLKAMHIVPEAGRPFLANTCGGLSGPAIKPVGVRCVFEAFGRVKIPIIGVGGVLTGRDAIEYVMAGARAVQVGSGVHYRGTDVFRKVCRELVALSRKLGFSSVAEMVGCAHRR